ncbi:MAG TPA: alpha/beta hydrolase [Micromonosporaceae bacterium]
MPSMVVGSESGKDIHLYYEDHGSGRPVVLIHGYPLSGLSWERQTRALLEAGYRVVTYDRRGFGWSSRPTIGFDYDTFAADLATVMERLDLTDAVLAGFSMGTGEIVRYLSRYGSGRVRKAVLLGVLPPFLLKTGDNPEGVDGSVFDGIKSAIRADRYAYLKKFLDDFSNVDVFAGTRISGQAWQAEFQVAAASSPFATYACVDAWLTDFRDDVGTVDVPVLAMHGTEDRILPFASTAKRLPAVMKDVRVVPVDGGPHNIGWTHADDVNRELLAFLPG